MKQYLGKITYDGSKFYGWAIQPIVRTVMGDLLLASKNYFEDNNCKIIGAGRTDRYVHALEQQFTIKTNSLKSVDEFLDYLNMLPDLEVLSLEEVKLNFNIRYAKSNKIYQYIVHLQSSNNYINSRVDYEYNYSYPLDFKKLEKATLLLNGTHDFLSFTAREEYKKTTRTVKIVLKREADLLIFTVSGPGFMRFMVRNIVGVLLAHNRGILDTDDLKYLLEHPKKGGAQYKAPGCGLYLIKIEY